MTLSKIVEDLYELDDAQIICADNSLGWNAGCETELLSRSELHAKKNVYPYFLGIHLAKEVLDAWSYIRQGQEPNLAQKCEALIFYAENHAYIQPEHQQ